MGTAVIGSCRSIASLISRAAGSGFTVLEPEFLCAVTCGVRSFFYLDADSILSSDDHSIEKYLLTNNLYYGLFGIQFDNKHLIYGNINLFSGRKRFYSSFKTFDIYVHPFRKQSSCGYFHDIFISLLMLCQFILFVIGLLLPSAV